MRLVIKRNKCGETKFVFVWWWWGGSGGSGGQGGSCGGDNGYRIVTIKALKLKT